jgi:hypothetical protein
LTHAGAAQVSLYGLLDRESWQHAPVPGLCRLENGLAVMGLHSCLTLYERNRASGDKLTLLEILPEIRDFPPSLIIGAEKDALVHSSLLALVSDWWLFLMRPLLDAYLKKNYPTPINLQVRADESCWFCCSAHELS